MKMYDLKVTEKELIRILYVMGCANGATYGKAAYDQAYEYLVENRGVGRAYQSNRDDFLQHHLITPIIDYYRVQEEWEEFIENLGRPSPVEQKIDLLEKELAELRKLV